MRQQYNSSEKRYFQNKGGVRYFEIGDPSIFELFFPTGNILLARWLLGRRHADPLIFK